MISVSATSLKKTPLYRTPCSDAIKLHYKKLPKVDVIEVKPNQEITNHLLTYSSRLTKLRPILYKIAQKRIRNDAWAEDAVSETIIAVLEKPYAYSGQSSLSTWLVRILKHKLADQIHWHTRECQTAEHVEEYDADFNTKLVCLNEQHAGWGAQKSHSVNISL